MVEEKEEFEMGIPNGVGEQMLAHAYEKFDIKLEQTEFGPKLIGEYDELVKVREFLENAIIAAYGSITSGKPLTDEEKTIMNLIERIKKYC